MQKLLFVFTFITFSFQISFAQSTRNTTDSKGTLLNNTSSPDTLRSSAILELRSTNRAFYPPRMPSDSLAKIPNPQLGAVIYDTDKKGIRIYNGNKWEMTSLPKSAMILSESYPNDTLTSAGYQYAGSVNVGQATSSRTIPHEDAPFYGGGECYGAWGQDKLFITWPNGATDYYDATTDAWNATPNPPTLNAGVYIIYRAVLKDKYVIVASDYTVYAFSISANQWATFPYPSTGETSITKIGNTLAFWKKGTMTINVFVGNKWYLLINDSSGPPSNATTLEYDGNLVFLWNENGVINGRKIDARVKVGYVPPSSPGYYPPNQNTLTLFNAPASRDSYGYKVIGKKLVIWGGNNGSSYTNSGSIYDFQNNAWATINTGGAPPAKSNSTINEYNGKIIICGGFNATTYGIQSGSGGIYDPILQNWTLINGGTAYGSGPSIFVLNNYLHFWHAYQTFGNSSFMVSYESYNLISNQWENYSAGTPVYRVVLWTGKYFIQWGGKYGVNSNVLGIFSNGGSIFGSHGFANEKIYHLYKKQ